jgi:hypothetical protein
MYKFVLLMVLFCGFVSYAQVNEAGYNKNRFSVGEIKKRPQSILSAL